VTASTDDSAGEPVSARTTPDDATRAAYELGALDWATVRGADHTDRAAALSRRLTDDGPLGITADLGCGPGWHLPALPDGCVALDTARPMLGLVPEHGPGNPRVQADLARLPFAPASLAAAFASKAYVHLDGRTVPRALADLHRALAPGADIALSFFGSGAGAGQRSIDSTTDEEDQFPGRCFSLWEHDHLASVLVGAGLRADTIDVEAREDGVPHIWVTGQRRHTLPDTVGPDMRLLVCGLNPSVRAADAGVGFVTPGNRFWPAALAAGLVTRDRDPFHALDVHGVGMTDLAKRATRRADELVADEYRNGLERVERLVQWLTPGAVCFVGLAGYRVAVDRAAAPGPQPAPLGGRPVYLMPSTSGLNAHSSPGELTDHLRGALALAARAGATG